MVHLALTAITSFSFFPLQVASIFGFIVSAVAVAAVPVIVALRLLGVSGLGGQTTVLTGVLLLGGIQLMFLGVIGEYLGRLYIEVKKRPLYILDTREVRPARLPRRDPAAAPATTETLS
jgi:dolichol-phosphate mannosyltransferase